MQRHRQKSKGFILPAIIMLGLGIMTASTGLYSMTLSSSEQVNSQTFDAIAREAAQAGVSMVTSCVKESPGTAWSVSLTPGKKCDGVTRANASAADEETKYVATDANGAWKSTFEARPAVNSPEYGPNTKKVVVVGTVQQYQGSSPVGTPHNVSRITILQPSVSIMPSPQGEVATDIKANSHACSINNGKLFCWGPNTFGMLGDGTTNQSNLPKQVRGVLDGKYVSKVSVSDSTTCAIADGRPYCWGNNLAGQVGNGDGSAFNVNLANVTTPTLVGAGLTGRLVTDISTSPSNTPLPQFIPTFQHSCALTDGAPYCWGGNEYQQVGGMNCHGVPFIGKICENFPYSFRISGPVPVYGYEDFTAPFPLGIFQKAVRSIVGVFDPVFGAVGVPGPGSSSWFGFVSGDSSDSKLYQKKLDRVAAGSHYSCGIAESSLYCWGIALPFNWGLPIMTLTVQPFNYTGFRPSESYWQDKLNPGQASDLTKSNYTFGSGLDADSFSMDGDMVCAAKFRDVGCMGFSPAYSGLGSIVTAYFMNAPFQLISNVDALGIDDGAWSIPLAGAFIGTLCVNDGGSPQCMGTNAAATGTGTGTFLIGAFKPLLKNGSPGLDNGMGDVKRTTKLAAAGQFGALIANGQVFTWGAPTQGQLGNNGAPATQTAATQIRSTTTPGEVFGARNDGGVSTYTWTASTAGKAHACGIQNGQVACWGKNDKGQLGKGANAITPGDKEPVAIPGFKDKMFTKISAGADHTCAIEKGHLYCWGDNSYGQLGIGGAAGGYEPSPRRVDMSVIPDAARVTAVSAGDRSTCAIIDGQAWCWGDDSTGQLGNGSGTGRDGTKTAPMRVGTAADILNKTPTKIDVGTDHACAVVDGDGYCWGDNRFGALGIGSTGSTFQTPRKITGGTAGVISPERLTGTFTDISAGNGFTCGIINSIVSCWGRNERGQLGDNTILNRNVPTKVKGYPETNQALSISAGFDHVCASVNGRIYCWGEQGNGRLGVNEPAPLVGSARKTVPQWITAGSVGTNTTTMVSAGFASSCSVSNGKLLCWGDSRDGQIGLNGLPDSQTTPVGTSDTVIPDATKVRGAVF